MSGTLYLCATPIGNLQDITLRALETLKSVDLILAEDTRHSIKLLNHFEIRKPLRSFHEHNAHEQIEQVLEFLKQGQNIAVISDAGTPLVSDPGSELVQKAKREGISVVAIPGPSAVLTALLSSGLSSGPFTFIGFLPRQSSARRELLEGYRLHTETLICFESPHRLKQALTDLLAVLGNRPACLCRELTKKFEESSLSDLASLAERFRQEEARGEITLVIAGADSGESAGENPQLYTEEDLQGRYDSLLGKGIHPKIALKELMQQTGLSRNRLYDVVVKRDV